MDATPLLGFAAAFRMTFLKLIKKQGENIANYIKKSDLRLKGKDIGDQFGKSQLGWKLSIQVLNMA